MHPAIFLLFCVGLAAAVPLQSRDVDYPDDNLSPDEIGSFISKLLKQNFDNIGGKIKELIEDASSGELWQNLQKDFNPEALKGLVENAFQEEGKVLGMMKEKAEKDKTKIMDLLDRLSQDRKKRALSEAYKILRELFRNVHSSLRHGFSKMWGWAKEKYRRGMELGRSKKESVKIMAKEFITDTAFIGKDIAKEALDFFRLYRKDLGSVYDAITEKVGKILKGSKKSEPALLEGSAQ